MRVTDQYVFFFTRDDIFSNHYHQQNPITYGSFGGLMNFHTVEHYMMYEKAILFGDNFIASDILQAKTPQQAKMLGRKVHNYDQAVWEENREDIVTFGLVSKMLANDEIKDLALDYHLSGRRFVEASPYDAIWGIKMGENDPGVEDPSNWKGQNLLGKCWEKAIECVIATKEVH